MSDPIRDATTEDIPTLIVIRQQAMEAGFTEAYSRSQFADLIAVPVNQLRDWITSQDVLVLVGETDITPICYGAYDHAAARILALYTATEYQGNGCGTAILKRFEQLAINANTHTVHATIPRNAVGFFERRGFHRDRTTNQDGIEMIEMSKSLK